MKAALYEGRGSRQDIKKKTISDARVKKLMKKKREKKKNVRNKTLASLE